MLCCISNHVKVVKLAQLKQLSGQLKLPNSRRWQLHILPNSFGVVDYVQGSRLQTLLQTCCKCVKYESAA